MTKPFISLLLLFIAVQAFTQTSDLNVIASSGGSNVTSGLNISWTVGESFTDELSNNTYSMAQGFHQGAVAVVALRTTDPVADNDIIAYPNPTRDQVTLQLEAYTTQVDWNLEVLTIDGKVIHRHRIESAKTEVDFTNYSNGSYFIRISNNKAFSKVFTILKQ